jgi:hypothetical protein
MEPAEVVTVVADEFPNQVKKKLECRKREEIERKKDKDIPFPVVYFGFIFGFIFTHQSMVYDTLPTQKEYQDSMIFPTRLSMLYLPLMSVFVICPMLFFWRAFLKENVFEELAKNWAGLPPKTMKSEKFCEQGWLALHYTMVTSLGYVVLRNKPWWPPVISTDAMLAISASQADREADHEDLGLSLLYAVQLGFYTLELATLLATKNRRSDAAMYFFHHIYTIILMFFSWMSYNQRVGSIVLFLHDVGDIFLPIGKCYTYAEEHIRETRSKASYEMHKTIGMAFFVMFVIAFAIPRLILYGSLIYQSVDNFHWNSCCGVDLATGYCGTCYVGHFWGTFLTGILALLYPMHVYWFYLIVKMATRLLLAPGKYNDVRSDDE